MNEYIIKCIKTHIEKMSKYLDTLESDYVQGYLSCLNDIKLIIDFGEELQDRSNALDEYRRKLDEKV